MKSTSLVFSIVLITLLLSGCGGQSIRSQGMDLQSAKKSPADVYVALGVEYMQRGLNDVALEKLQTAVRVDPSSSDAHNVIAVLYDRLGQFSQAGTHYERAVRLGPNNSSAHNNYARYLCGNKDYEKADKHFLQALKNPLYKSPLLALTNAGNCATKAGKLDEADRYLRTALQRNKRFSPALFQMAKLKFEQKNYLSVRAYLQRFRMVQKSTSASLWLAIQAEDKLGDRNAVASSVLKLQQLFPDSHETSLLEKSKFSYNISR